MKYIHQILTAVIFFGLTLTAANAQTLKGDWKLVEAQSNGEKVVYTEEIRTTVSFGENGGMFGNSGCNRYSTSYKLTGKKIQFNPIISTKMACDGERMKQESTFFSVIEKVKYYKTAGEYLIFYDKSSRNILKFAPAPAQTSLNDERRKC